MVFFKNLERDYDPVDLAICEGVFEAHATAARGPQFLDDCRSGREPDENESDFVAAARVGDVRTLQQLLFEKKKALRPAFLNQARRRTEVDEFTSVVLGFPEYEEWFDLTALATAAKEMHPDAVYFLLRQGADPTLKGCPEEGVIYDPMDAATDGYKRALRMIHLGSAFSFHVTDAKVLADMAFDMLEDARKCRAMIAACTPFWKPAPYGDADEYSDVRADSGFTNRPTDQAAMLKALNEARNSKLDADEQKDLDELKAKLVAKLERVYGTEEKVLRGKVKWFSAAKGYGYIAQDQEGDDKENEEFFVHKSNIQGSRVLKPREKVQFMTRPSRNGKLDLAVRVTKISEN